MEMNKRSVGKVVKDILRKFKDGWIKNEIKYKSKKSNSSLPG